jgi:hypothetical protein
MFSTVLREVTGYFDRRVLISTFFPSLVFIGGTLLLVLLTEVGETQLVHTWNQQSGTIQAILIVGFLVLIAFWTFALVNLRDALDRLFQGYWPGAGLVEVIARHVRARFERRRAGLINQDRELERLAGAIRDEKLTFPAQQEIIAAAAVPAPAGNPGASVDRAITDFQSRLDALEQADPAAAVPSGLADQLRDAWKLAAAHVQDANPGDGTAWGQRLDHLNRATGQLSTLLDRLAHQLDERRLQLHRRLFLFYPPAPESVMPTALGNVLKSAERYPWQRYRLDAVVIWPRLQPLLPSGSDDLLQQAKTSLDLLLTLASFTWLFGVPLALWTVISAAWPAHSPAVTVLAALALAVCMLLLASRPVRLAAAALLVVVVVTLAVAPFSGSSTACADIARAGVFLILAAGITLLGWALYRNAVQAGLAYGEQLKAVFDLHRWRVFEQLHFQAPQDLAEEQRMWEQLTIMLYRGTSDSLHFRYAAQDPAKPAGAEMPRFWVPTRDLPAYRPFAADDLIPAEPGSTDLPSGAVEESSGGSG